MVAEFKKRVEAGMSASKASQGLGANPASVRTWAKASAPKPTATNGTGTGASQDAETDKVVFERRGWKIEITPPTAATTSKSELIKALTSDKVKQQLIRGALKLPDAQVKPKAEQGGAEQGGAEPDTDPDDDEETEDDEE